MKECKYKNEEQAKKCSLRISNQINTLEDKLKNTDNNAQKAYYTTSIKGGKDLLNDIYEKYPALRPKENDRQR